MILTAPFGIPDFPFAAPVGLHEMVPMLHGRSSKGKGVVVSGITECGESYKTYFGGVVRPGSCAGHSGETSLGMKKPEVTGTSGER